MNLYDRYVEWASEKIAKHVIAPIMNSEKTWKACEKMVELNDKVAEKTGYDYLEKRREAEEYAKANPKKTALKRIGKTIASSLLFGGISDYRNLHD